MSTPDMPTASLIASKSVFSSDGVVALCVVNDEQLHDLE